MATTTRLLTWQEFEQLPGKNNELLEGELITLPPPKSRHSRIALKAARLLMPLEDHGLGQVGCEAGYKLSDNPSSWIQPDVSFLKIDRVQATDPDSYYVGAPELAIEVVSPSETAVMLDRKLDLLLSNGSLAVWVIYPEKKEVRVFLPDGTSFKRGSGDVLTLPELLPAWELPVAKLFED